MITVLSGDNTYAIQRFLREQISGFDGDITRKNGDEISQNQLGDLFMGASLFSTKRIVIVNKLSENKPLWADVESWIERVPKEIDVYLVEPRPDKRTKTYKTLQKQATVRMFNELDETELSTWLQSIARDNEIDLTDDLARYFIGYVGRDQWRLQNELEKLVLAQKPLTRELIQEVSEPYPEATAFELLDGLFSNDTPRVEKLLVLLRETEDPYQFFGLLSSQTLALVALVHGGERRADDVARDLSIHPFVVRKLSQVSRRFNKQRLSHFVARLAEADIRIKTMGVDPWDQLSRTLLASRVDV
jgi:DNA polymerase III subunit delta